VSRGRGKDVEGYRGRACQGDEELVLALRKQAIAKICVEGRRENQPHTGEKRRENPLLGRPRGHGPYVRKN